jgi:hypothetical protein
VSQDGQDSKLQVRRPRASLISQLLVIKEVVGISLVGSTSQFGSMD